MTYLPINSMDKQKSLDGMDKKQKTPPNQRCFHIEAGRRLNQVLDTNRTPYRHQA